MWMRITRPLYGFVKSFWNVLPTSGSFVEMITRPLLFEKTFECSPVRLLLRSGRDLMAAWLSGYEKCADEAKLAPGFFKS